MPTADTLSPPTPTRQKAIVEAHGISKQFGELEVLTNIDFSPGLTKAFFWRAYFSVCPQKIGGGGCYRWP